MLQPAVVQTAYSSFCVTDLSATWVAPHATVTVADVQTYLAGLQQGAQLQRKAVTTATQQNRDKALQEFSTWLASRVKCRNLESCLPEDFVVYLITHWADQHATPSAHSSGSAAPVSVNALVSHLAIELDKLGRVGNWQPDTKQGENPASNIMHVYTAWKMKCKPAERLAPKGNIGMQAILCAAQSWPHCARGTPRLQQRKGTGSCQPDHGQSRRSPTC